MAKKKKASRKQCQEKGCRRVARKEGLCQAHYASIGPEEKVQELTIAEAEQWGRLMAEFTTHNQAAQLLAYKAQEIQRDRDARIAKLNQEREHRINQAKEIRVVYEQVTDELCKRYGMDRERTVIDIETRVIREEKPQNS
jgi:hypothetical protein